MSIAENTDFVNSGDVAKSDLLLDLLTNIINARRDRGWDVSPDALNLISNHQFITNSDMSTIINELTYHGQGINYIDDTFISIPEKGSVIYKDYINKLQIARADIVNLVKCSSGCTSACVDTCTKNCSHDCSKDCGKSCTGCGEECKTSCGTGCSSECNTECSGCVDECSGCGHECTGICSDDCTRTTHD